MNTGARIGHKEEDMKWPLDTIQLVVTVPLTLDRPDSVILETAFQMVGKTPMINSISLEKVRFDAIMPFLSGRVCKVIAALCMDDLGMPTSSADIVGRAIKRVEELNGIGYQQGYNAPGCCPGHQRRAYGSSHHRWSFRYFL